MPAKCPKCGGRYRVDSSRRAGSVQVQYVACQQCRNRGKQLVPADQVWRRTRT